MKRVNKILSTMLCSVVIIGCNNLSLIKSNAQTVNKDCIATQQIDTRSVSKQSTDKWVTTVQIRLHHKLFSGKKLYWCLKLACTENGELVLRGTTRNVPNDFTFDDTYKWGYDKNGKPCTVAVFRGLLNVNAGSALQRAIDDFNRTRIRKGQTFFMYGENSNDSLRFANTIQPNGNTPISIIQHNQNKNNYSQGYNYVDKFKVGFRVEEKGLSEVNYDSKQ